MSYEIREKIKRLIEISSNSLLLNFRFLDTAIGLLNIEEAENIGCICTDSDKIYYDVDEIKNYIRNKESIDKLLLHITLHLILGHVFEVENKEKKFWDFACDLAVESIIAESGLNANSNLDFERIYEIEAFKQKNIEMNANKIYTYILKNHIDNQDFVRLSKLFSRDNHYLWYERYDFDDEEEATDDYSGKKVVNSRKKLSERVSNNINEKSFRKWKQSFNSLKTRYSTDAKNSNDIAGNIYQKILEVKKDEINYSNFLRHFASISEQLNINEDEFDYIYYTYGLSMYLNVPLIEALEYKDDMKIKEFAIVLDTSGSCTGEIVQKFLEKTYSILSNEEYFSNDMNVLIIQADAKIQSVHRIKSINDFDEFIKTQKLTGFGGTDFTPAFGYIDELVEKNELQNFKGVLYFTDGYGTFPEYKPNYKSAFVFLDTGLKTPEVPHWAMKVVVGRDDLVEEKL